MTTEKGSVELANGQSASVILYEVLDSALQSFADDFVVPSWPSSSGQFRKQYVSVLPEFEAARLGSTKRHEIAIHLAVEIQKRLVWQSQTALPLSEALQQPSEALHLQSVIGSGEPGWLPEFRYLDKDWGDLSSLGEQLCARHVITSGAADSLSRISQSLVTSAQGGGRLHLKDRKIAVLGAAAEMAPTLKLLQTGAHVLWIDKAPPSDELMSGSSFSGSLSYIETADLLTQPAEILQTLVAFADGTPIDLCLYAYAPGQARELRLTGVMNAIVNALPQALIASVTLLVSPTTPTQLQESDIEVMTRRVSKRPGWESALAAVGLLGSAGGSANVNGEHAIRSVVSIQGASYQAAQYLGKVMMAESWATQGQLTQNAQPLRVSANTAAITQTKSLDHPVFDAAFGGAAALQVETFTPEQSKTMNALLAIADWLDESPPLPGKVRVHGGIHTLPYPLEAALKPAAAIGFAKAPKLLLGLLKGR